jgi:hypothetical protein
MGCVSRLWAVVALAGCTGHVVPTAEGVVGPHGQDTTELLCSYPRDCMTKAREVCGGDFDVVMTLPAAPSALLVHCLVPRGADAGVPAR